MSSLAPTPNSLVFTAPTYTVADLIAEVRINTKIPNPQQLSDARILYYLNQFITMDLSKYVQHFAYKSLWIFNLIPLVDKYDFPLNQYISIANSQCLVNGYNCDIFQNYTEFNSAWQNQQQNQAVAVGDGVNTNYIFEVFHPAVRGHFDPFGNYLTGVNITGTTSSGQQLSLWDNGNGEFFANAPYTNAGTGTIDYFTGLCNVTFQYPVLGPIFCNVNTFTLGQPSAVLFYSNVMTFRDVPNRPYNVQVECYVNPVAYVNTDQPVILNNSFRLFVYGTARYILSEYKDVAQLTFLNTFIDEQIRLIKRVQIRTINQAPISSCYNSLYDYVPWQSNIPYGAGQ